MRYKLLNYKSVLPAITVSLLASELHAEVTQGTADATGAMPTSSLAADAYTVDNAQTTFVSLYKAGEYDEATDAGKLVIKLLLEESDHTTEQWSGALAQLATAQRKNGQFDQAIQNYKAAIELLVADSDRLNARLVDPLWGLSRTYAAADRGDMALSSYQKTLHIKQINGGLHNVEQAELLLEMSDILFQRGEYSEANALQKANVNLAKHNYPGDNLRKLPAMYTRADMLVRSGENLKAQRSYREILRLVKRAEGARSLSLLPVLLELSDESLYEVSNVKFSIQHRVLQYLRRAVRITDKNEDATDLQKADAHLAMGDFVALNVGDRTSALRSYRKAWDFLSGDAELLTERDKRFAEPRALNDVPSHLIDAFWGLKKDPTESDKNGFVVVTYDVTKKGKIDNMQVAESSPAGYKDYAVIRHLRNIFFRPSFVARNPTATINRRYEVRYTYNDDDLPGSIKDALEKEASASADP